MPLIVRTYNTILLPDFFQIIKFVFYKNKVKNNVRNVKKFNNSLSDGIFISFCYSDETIVRRNSQPVFQCSEEQTFLRLISREEKGKICI